jgi:hypothetical protein
VTDVPVSINVVIDVLARAITQENKSIHIRKKLDHHHWQKTQFYVKKTLKPPPQN